MATTEMQAWAEMSASFAGKKAKYEDMEETNILCGCAPEIKMLRDPKMISGCELHCPRCKAMSGCMDDVLP